MKKIVLFHVVCLLLWIKAYGQSPKASLADLNLAIREAAVYDKAKQHEIDSLQSVAARLSGEPNLHKHYRLYTALFDAYKIYKYDSACSYARKMNETAIALQDDTLLMETRLKLSFTLLSSGMYKETAETLSSIKVASLPDSSKANYYALMGRFYYDLGDYNKDTFYTPPYTVKANSYIDSALALWPANSYDYIYFSGLKALKTGLNDTALQYFRSLLDHKKLSLHEIAVTASTLSVLYTNQGDSNQAIDLLILAAIADIKTSTKETSATFILANLLYRKNDVKNASVCIEQAIAEATFYGARQRKVQVSAILPLIEAEKVSIVESQKVILVRYAVTVTLLLLLVIGLGFIIYKQVKRLKAAQLVIYTAHEKEQAINRQLAEANEKLSDANKIKEQYIGYFFNLNAAFYEKIEKFKKSIDKKIADRKLDDIRQLTNTINLKNEKQELLKHFDHAFLKLFPHFITTFNALFREEDHIVLEDDELMNTDLRIFALIRMGIHDTDKIAHILQYSVNTINTYKTRVKNKSIVVNEEFEKRIMEIKAV
ncbi:DUF6377 domain-containing protein [Chitinophaga sp. 30R24]|uniref:DUF6377 domain-containing protein n=1 Tax=Chitinophaga sp. 30R24 TaxID=3248838 RepID=UPI003B919B27